MIAYEKDDDDVSFLDEVGQFFNLQVVESLVDEGEERHEEIEKDEGALFKNEGYLTGHSFLISYIELLMVEPDEEECAQDEVPWDAGRRGMFKMNECSDDDYGCACVQCWEDQKKFQQVDQSDDRPDEQPLLLLLSRFIERLHAFHQAVARTRSENSQGK